MTNNIREYTHKGIGNKIRRLRQIKGLSQKQFAAELKVSQQAVSKIEQSNSLTEETLDKVAQVLDVPSSAITNFDDEAAFNNFINSSGVINQNCDVTTHHHSIEKIQELYERLLQSEKEKNELLKNMLNEKKE